MNDYSEAILDYFFCNSWKKW